MTLMDARTAPSAPPAALRAGSGLRGLLASADIRLDGSRPWDLRVLDPRLFRRVGRRGLTGLGEAYVEGWWEAGAVDQFFDRALRAGLAARLRWHPLVVLTVLRDRLVNRQTLRRAFPNARRHYDLGADLFRATLDRRMTYSCAHWRHARTLDEAQEAKLDLVCRKLGLRPGMSVLDIGCGWGSFVKYAAETRGVRAVGVTVSGDQARYARESCEGLDVEIRLEDYRQTGGTFDRVASIGMFEHVGPKNYRTFMNVARRRLADDGLMLLHTFASRDPFPNRTRSEVDWIERNIFPGLVVPSMGQVGAALDRVFVVEDVENIGADYDPTLMAWHDNFERAWPSLAATYGERFRRTWRYYLLSCAGAFRARAYQVWQLVLSPRGVDGGYARPGPAGADA